MCRKAYKNKPTNVLRSVSDRAFAVGHVETVHTRFISILVAAELDVRLEKEIIAVLYMHTQGPRVRNWKYSDNDPL